MIRVECKRRRYCDRLANLQSAGAPRVHVAGSTTAPGGPGRNRIRVTAQDRILVKFVKVGAMANVTLAGSYSKIPPPPELPATATLESNFTELKPDPEPSAMTILGKLPGIEMATGPTNSVVWKP